MENDFKISFLLSLAVHAAIFVFLSLQLSRSAYITVPVELFFAGPSPAPAVSPSDELKAKKPEEKEIVIPKKAKDRKPKKETAKKQEETKAETPPAPAPAPPAEGMARPSAPSGQISLDAARFPYSYYTNMIVKKIGRFWQWTTDYGRARTVVYFRITRDGSISEVRVKDSSGDRLFDQQALRAVQLASPFPPLPDGYDGDSLGVYFEFTFKG